MNRKTMVSVAVLALLGAFLGAGSAFAYDETYVQAGFAEPRPCYTCHGMVGAETTQTVDPATRDAANLRKGPHGGYTATSSQCSACHTVHAAPAGGVKLLPAATIRSTCEHCHDGTGGQGVYGVIEARTGWDPAVDGAAHRIEVAGNNTIPGGSTDGGPREGVMFSGPGGTLTCSDCHSPHDANTVQSYLGDRWRSADGTSTVSTNRLLRQQPAGQLPGEEISADRYGTVWCFACHRGHGELSGVGAPVNHPVAYNADGYFYDNVLRWSAGAAGFDEGPLGQSNAGYVMPDVSGSRPAGWPTAAAGGKPICQQCHEDSRRAGQTPGSQFEVVHPSETFTITQRDGLPDGEVYDGGSQDNPRFQTFPHESLRPGFLAIEDVNPDGDAVGQDALCLRCHYME